MLPTSWHDINVAQMLEISRAGSSIKDITHLLNLFIDVENEDMSVFMDAAVEFAKVLNSKPDVVPCEDVYIGREHYRLRPIEELSVSEYIDFDEFKDKPLENLTLLLAIIYSADGDTGDYITDVKRKSKEFLDCPADVAQSALLFFSERFLAYTNNFLGSLLQEHPEMKVEVEKIQSLLGMTSSLENQNGTSQTEEQSMD